MFTPIKTLQLPAQLEAILFGQDNVQNDTLWMLAKNLLKSLVAINGGHHIEPVIAQRSRDHRQFCPAIIDNKYLLPWHTSIPFLRRGAIQYAQLMGKKGYTSIIRHS